MTLAENRELWRSRVAEFKASGLSAAAWCEAHDLKVHQLRYWIHKYKSIGDLNGSMQWLSLELGDSKMYKPQEALPIRIGKATIEVGTDFDPKLLADVVRTLSAL